MRKRLLLSLGGIIIIFVLYTAFTQYSFSDKNLTVVFCNVGQGDALLLRTPEKYTVLIDSGPDKKVTSCLGNHLPFWESHLTLGILTHPHLDHFQGFIDVLGEYQLARFVTEKLGSKLASYQLLQQRLIETRTKQQLIAAGDRFTTPDGITLQVLYPTKKALELTSPQGFITDTKEFSSLILLITYKDFQMLVTGDSQKEQIKEALAISNPSQIDVLHVPHHGSRFGLDDAVLKRLRPRVGVISVGKNTYGHPSQEVLSVLQHNNVQILRTDEKGDIVIKTDGKKWWVR